MNPHKVSEYMKSLKHDQTRRRLLKTTAALAAVAAKPAAAALLTPRQSLGPFYPESLPNESDADLTRMKGQSGIAAGEVTDLSGVIVDPTGQPIPGVLVEIWQCDAGGNYHHPRDRKTASYDSSFQGYGRRLTDADGAYAFRTIKPVPYPGRTPHIHFQVSGEDIQTLVTQMYVAGEDGNEHDGLFMSAGGRAKRDALLADFRAVESEGIAWRVEFKIVVAAT
ncbi:MAG: intradiol ring-cleavage dioxygenase [Arenicellales bacterium WSBS_2016_MAG_OTU3]